MNNIVGFDLKKSIEVLFQYYINKFLIKFYRIE